MSFLNVKVQRLTELMQHLIDPKIKTVDVFKFDDYYKFSDENGTSGCGLVECCFLWPDLWRLHEDGTPYTFGNKNKGPITCAQEFFGLDWLEARHLFCPECQQTTKYIGCSTLFGNATRAEVAENIYIFLEYTLNQARETKRVIEEFEAFFKEFHGAKA